jgi:homoserine kinase type II
LCLRRWPAGHPNQERLDFIQAVLWHVHQEGFRRAPLPLETRHHHGHVWHEGHLWELTPWLPGAADYRERTNPARLSAALKTLAEFHNATASFPIPEPGPAVSPGLTERRERLTGLLAGRAEQLREGLARTDWPDVAPRGRLLLDLFCQTSRKLLPAVEAASQIAVGLQPCLRDIWHAHVLFEGDRVTGLVDFGSMRPDNVATDIARLLGSMAVDNHDDWQLGLLAYQGVRRLGENELALVEMFDRTAVLMSGLQWLEWICLEQRDFSDPAAVLARVDECLARLQVLANRTSTGQKA